MAFHPDKHPDPENKAIAENTFRNIQKAYEVLSDREKRAVYDHFGEQGLQSSWSVSLRGQTPAEMQAEFERQSRLRQAADAESLVKSRGEFTAMVDASSLFASSAAANVSPLRRPVRPYSLSERIGRVNCSQLLGKHSFDMPILSASTLTLSGQMLSRRGIGGGNLVGTLKTQWSPRFFSETSATLLRPQVFTNKGQYTLDENVFFTYALVAQTLAAPPAATLTWGQRLSSKSSLTGFTSFKSGGYSIGSWGLREDGSLVRPDVGALVVGVTKQQLNGTGWTGQCTLAEVDQAIGFEHSARLYGVLISSGLTLGLASGITAFTNGEQRITENVRVGLGVECGMATGVSFKIRIVRLGQRVVLPILLSPQFRTDIALAATVIPAVGVTLAQYFYFGPRRRRQHADRLAKLRRVNKEALPERRVNAEQTRELLRGQASKRAEAECARRGVVIVQALYGRRDTFPAPVQVPSEALKDPEKLHEFFARPYETPSSTASEDQPLFWDVRVPLQMLVSHGQLVIPSGRSKAKLIGFFDPCIGESKTLYVRYVFRGQVHEFSTDDQGAVAAPLRTQQV